MFSILAILIGTIKALQTQSYCGLVTPNITTDCTQFNNEFYSCCYVELNFVVGYSPKACIGLLNSWNQTLPATTGQFQITNVDCGTPITKALQDSMFCGNNITTLGPQDCYNSSNYNMNCCEFIFDNYNVCVDTTTLGNLKSTIIDSITCDSSYIFLSVIILLYVILV
jgi:hypothetical protein